MELLYYNVDNIPDDLFNIMSMFLTYQDITFMCIASKKFWLRLKGKQITPKHYTIPSSIYNKTFQKLFIAPSITSIKLSHPSIDAKSIESLPRTLQKLDMKLTRFENRYVIGHDLCDKLGYSIK